MEDLRENDVRAMMSDKELTQRDNILRTCRNVQSKRQKEREMRDRIVKIVKVK